MVAGAVLYSMFLPDTHVHSKETYYGRAMRRHLHIQTDLIGYILTTHLPCAWDLVLWVFVLPGLGRIRLSRVCFQGAVDRVRLRA